MEQKGKLSIEEKLRLIRKEKDIPQSVLAEALNYVPATISRIESKKEQHKYSDEQIRIIRKLLGVENAPLLDKEDIVFKKRLYVWLDIIKARRFDEAQELQNELSIITQLPFEIELILLFKLFEIRFLLAKGDVKSAEEKTELTKPLLEGAANEALYHFNYNMGMLCMYEKSFEEALFHFSLADSLEITDFEKESTLYVNIAACNYELGMYMRTIGTLAELYHLFKYDRTSIYGVVFENLLASSYTAIGDVDQAKKLLEKCLISAKGFNDKAYIGIILHNYGCACFKVKEYTEALDYFERAFEYFKAGGDFYFENLYFKIRCLIASKNPLRRDALIHAKSLLDDTNKDYSLLFTSLEKLLALKEEPSRQYIETITIPYLIDRFMYSKALDYCKVLEDYFTKNRNAKKALEYGALAHSIKDKIMKGGSP